MPDADIARGHGFVATPSDDLFITHPETGALITSAGLSLDVDTGDIKVQFDNDIITVIPAGILAASVRHNLRIRKLFATGTGVLNVFIWID